MAKRIVRKKNKRKLRKLADRTKMNNCLDSLRKHLKHSPGDGMLAVTDRLLNLDHNWQYDPVQCEQVKDFIKTNVQFDIK